MISKVIYTKFAEKQLTKIPKYIKESLNVWGFNVERIGISEMRKIKGYHDEPLRGERIGQRSIRLSHSYRAIYVEQINGEIILLTVIEVNKHDY